MKCGSVLMGCVAVAPCLGGRLASTPSSSSVPGCSPVAGSVVLIDDPNPELTLGQLLPFVQVCSDAF